MRPAISLTNVSKRYRIGQAPFSLRSLLSSRRGARADRYRWALKDLTLALEPGQALGIIGPNGAGKTTVLKLLSRVTYPTTGEIDLSGRISALIELGAGFHPELSGRENIFLNGTILGMSRAEIKERFDEIVEFAGITDYLDTPVKRYSSGMYARLGFAVAAHVEPDVLLVDEVLAVGDMAFQRKCYDRMLHLIQKGTALVFVTHNMSAVQRVCPTCLVLYRGRPAFQGRTPEATAEYSNILRTAAHDIDAQPVIERGLSELVMTHAGVIEDVQMLRADGLPSLTFASGETALVLLKVRFKERAPAPVFACTIRLPDGQIAYNFTTGWAGIQTPDFPANSQVQLEYRLRLDLAEGIYQLGTDLAYHDLTRYYDRFDRALDFVVTGGNGARGVANLKAEFRVMSVEALQD